MALDDAHALDFRLQRLGFRTNTEALDEERRNRFAKRDASHDQDERHAIDRKAGYDLARYARRGRGGLGGSAQEGAGQGDEKRTEQRARGGALLAGGELLGGDPGENDEQKALGNCHKAREEVVRREGPERIHVEEHAHGRIVETRIGQRQHEQQRRTRDLVHGLLLHLGVLDDRALALGRALWGDARQTLLGLDDLAANSRTVGRFHRFGVAGEGLLDFREVLFGRASRFVVEKALAGLEEGGVAVGAGELAGTLPVVVGRIGNDEAQACGGVANFLLRCGRRHRHAGGAFGQRSLLAKKLHFLTFFLGDIDISRA